MKKVQLEFQLPQKTYNQMCSLLADRYGNETINELCRVACLEMAKMQAEVVLSKLEQILANREIPS